MPRVYHKPLTQIPPQALTNFWKHFIVGPPDHCWPWIGAIRASGRCAYGYMRVEYQKWQAPRIAYYIHKGVDPDQLLVCHTCDNIKCVNPAHLFLGTDRDNALDRHRKGRTVMPWNRRRRVSNHDFVNSANHQTENLPTEPK